MRVHKTVALWAILPLIGACGESPTEPLSLGEDVMFGVVAGSPVVGTVTGSGHAPCGEDVPQQCSEGGDLRTFSFSARVHADGSVSGRAQIKNRENGLTLKMNAECVNFFGDNQNRAWIIGAVTQSNFFPVGLRVGFAVADNGEGGDAAPDQITGVGPGPDFFIAWVCEPGPDADAQLDFFFDNVFGFDIASGDVQVRAPEAS